MNGSMKAVAASGISSISLSLIAAQPRMLEPSMPKPSVNEASRQFSDGIRNVMLQAGNIRETNIGLPRAIILRDLQGVGRCHVQCSC